MSENEKKVSFEEYLKKLSEEGKTIPMNSSLEAFSTNLMNRVMDELSGPYLDLNGRNQIPISIKDFSGNLITEFQCWVVRDDELKAGLRGVTSMPDEAGMFFLIEIEDNHHFTMKGVSIPLDVIFIDRNLNIVDIHHNMQPSERVIACRSDKAYNAIEVNSGLCQRFNIDIGCKIDFDKDLMSQMQDLNLRVKSEMR